MAADDNTEMQPKNVLSRRDALKSMGAVAAGLAAAQAPPAVAADAKPDPCEAKNPYGAPPGSGISMPPYYRPTPSVSVNPCCSSSLRAWGETVPVSQRSIRPVKPAGRQSLLSSPDTRPHLIQPSCSNLVLS